MIEPNLPGLTVGKQCALLSISPSSVYHEPKGETEFCVEALDEAIRKFGPPEIMNTDQGPQVTSFAWTDRLRRSALRISMDGKGRFLDNIFVERLWRSMKYECVNLQAWEAGSEAKAGVRKWMAFYNHKRPIPPLAADHQPWSIG